MKLTRIISAFFVMLMCFAPAPAQSDRTYVSAHGLDEFMLRMKEKREQMKHKLQQPR